MPTPPPRLLAALALGAATLGLAACRHVPERPSVPETAQSRPPWDPRDGEADGQQDATTAQAQQAWWKGAVFYEIFVRSFRDSDGDGVGDLRGLIERLDYLNDGDPDTDDDLGVDALWLMPINPSPSYHGYDVTDYRGVNPDYGDLDDLDALLDAAHARGIRVVTDLVLNHSSRQHPWFQSARRGPDAPRRDWYTFRSEPITSWRRPWDGASVWHRDGPDSYYYALFWEGMPDLNLANPAVEAELLDTMRLWLGRGVDGFRVDAIRYLIETPDGQLADTPATHALVGRLRAMMDREYPDAVLIGEVWSDVEDQASYYQGGEGLHLAFSFDLAGKLISALDDGVRSDLNAALDRGAEAFADRSFEAPFLTNHDMRRALRALRGDTARARLAAAILLSSPGTPFIYYGEELGMAGGAAGGDEAKRTPMRWAEVPGVGFTSGHPWYPIPAEAPGTDVASQRADEGSLLSLYRRLIRLRHANPALGRGDQRRLDIDGGRGVVAFVRTWGDARALVVVNLDDAPSHPFVAPVVGHAEVLYAEGLSAPPSPAADGGGVAVAALAPRGFAWMTLQ